MLNIQSIITHARENFPNDAKELYEALGLIDLALDGLREKTIRKLSDFAISKQYGKSKNYLEISEGISRIQTYISEYSAMLINDVEGYEEDDELDIVEHEEEQQKDIPSYADCLVDRTIAHTLYESFTHTRPCAFSFNGKKHKVNDWKSILLHTCNLLSEIDSDKFYEFINDPSMKGRKINYFGNTYIEKKNEKMKNIDVYVWTNLSANSIRNIIRKLLKKFDLKISEFYIYLTADYKTRHTYNIANTEIDGLDSSEVMIGKYVRLKIRQISNMKKEFSTDEIAAMQSKQWSKETLDIDFSLLKQYNPQINISEQVKEGSLTVIGKSCLNLMKMRILLQASGLRKTGSHLIDGLSSY